MSTSDAEAGYLNLVPKTHTPFRNEVSARVALSIITHRPGKAATDISCPIMFNICDLDTVAPAHTTLRHARSAPRADIHHYPVGHFDIYVGEPFEQVIADQLDFLNQHVPPDEDDGGLTESS